EVVEGPWREIPEAMVPVAERNPVVDQATDSREFSHVLKRLANAEAVLGSPAINHDIKRCLEYSRLVDADLVVKINLIVDIVEVFPDIYGSKLSPHGPKHRPSIPDYILQRQAFARLAHFLVVD